MLKGSISFEGKTQADVEMAIEEALRVIKNGNRSGFNENEDGEFSFEISGEEDEDEDEPENDDDTFIVSEFGNDYVCRDFTDVDPDRSGVDVSLDDEHIGEILGISIPDPNDKEEVEKFRKEVIEWIVDNDK